MAEEVVIDDDDDEFEPLFSYERVCKPPSDDDSDEDVTIIDSKTWQSATKHGGGNVFSSSLKSKSPLGKRIHEDLNKEVEEEDDWLPPPPKSAKTLLESKINEDPTVREIRQKREELMWLTASSEAAVRKLEEDSRVQNSASKPTPDGAHQQVSAAGKRDKVLISVQNKDGVCKAFRVFKDDKFEKLFLTYAESICMPPNQLIFIFDGQKILGHNTPKDLDIEDEDIIEVNLRT